MLSAAVLNGFAIWIRNVIYWIVRVWYAMKNAVEVTAVCDTVVIDDASAAAAKKFHFTYEGQRYTVKALGLGKEYSDVTLGQKASLLWIPYSKRAEFSRYKTDEKSKKTLLLCDVLSLAGLVLLVMGIVLLESSADLGLYTLTEGTVIGSVALMIVMSFIRKTCRR